MIYDDFYAQRSLRRMAMPVISMGFMPAAYLRDVTDA